MIKINLALRKQAPSVAGEQKTGLTSLKSIKLDSDTLSELPIRKIGVIIALGFAANYFLEDYKASEIAKLDAELSAEQATLNQLRLKNNAVKQIFMVKTQLEADEKILRTKIETIRNLVADRENPPRMLRSLVDALPENVWLDSFMIKGRDVQFQGGALQYEEISDFMSNLSQSAYFDAVDLKSTEQKRLGSAEVKTFSIQAARK